MKISKLFICGLLATLVAGCGGGGGDAKGVTADTTAAPSISLIIVDSSGNEVTNNAIGNGSNYYAYSVVKDASSAVVGNALVTFSVSDATVATLLSTTTLSDSTTGIAKVQIKPASYSSGTAVLTASTTVNSTAATKTLNIQTASSAVTLNTMTAALTTVSAFQNTGVTVTSSVDGVAATTGAVSVNFTASCGTFSPVTAYSDSTGTITSTYEPGVDCGGAVVTLTATAIGSSSSKTATVSVTTSPASSVNYVEATVPLLVSKSVGGQNSRSRLKFKVLDSAGEGMGSQTLTATLAQSSIAAGITFEDGSITAQTLTTSSDGTASVGVIAGNLFSSVLVTASLADSTKSATSYGVAVTSGRATQNSLSIAATSLSMEAWNIDGVTNTISVIVADRLGNPLPVGTVVNFISNNGVITGIDSATRGSCTLTALSSCSVTYTSTNGGSRPDNGRVAILAYLNGEESFVDANGNNMWESGETFYAVGRPYLDANENGIFDLGEQKIGTSIAGSSSCPANAYPSEENTCNTSAWSADVLVRKQIVIVQATSTAKITEISRTINELIVLISDANLNNTVILNSMPTGSEISAVITPTVGACNLLDISRDKVPNTTLPILLSVYMEGAGCLEAKVAIKVTAPSLTKTTVTF